MVPEENKMSEKEETGPDPQVSLEKIVASDLPRGVALLGDLSSNVKNVYATVSSFRDKIKDGEIDISKGLSLLELKNQTFLSYLINLTYTMLRKLSGAKLEGDPSIERLIELRATIERLRPLEDKLKYRIDKYVKVANEGMMDANDPLKVKGNLDNIGSSSDEEEEKVVKKKAGTEDNEADSKASEEVQSSKAYKVPKIAPVPYDEEEDKKEAILKARRRALNSAVVRDALIEHAEEPEVVHDLDILKQKSVKKRKELEAYEEDNFVRKSLSKREEAEMNKMTTIGTLRGEILGFGNVDALQEGYDPSRPAKRQKTMKSGKKKKGKGKSKSKKAFKKRTR